MDGRCAVETWAEFDCSETSYSPRLKFVFGTEVILCTGSEEVFVFSTDRRKLKAVLKFPGPVSDLAGCHHNHLLYVACHRGVYCVRLQSLLSRSQSSPADSSSCPAELHISSESLCVPDEKVLSLLVVGSVLLTVSLRDTSWVFTLYNSPKESESNSCEMLTSFGLPVVSSALENSETNTDTITRPVLMCVHSSDTTSSTHLPDDHFCLEPALFKLLFGLDATLAKSPVILCGLPDGCLCFLSLRPPGSRLRVLHSLEQPVVFVGASSVVDSLGHAQCLVAVGVKGKVVLIKVNKEGAEGGGKTADFTEGCVPGPVMCGCVDKNCLYYSTGSDLLVLDLSEGSGGREGQEETSNKAGTALQSPRSLNVCRIIALAEHECKTGGEAELLALSVRGQLQRITLPERREEATSSTQAGRSIRDLLSAIGDVCERASALKTSIRSKNQILMHLNQVLNISFLLTASMNSEEHLTVQEKPIRCHAVTRWSRLLQKDSLNLTCVLENSSPYVLERGWTLSITVFPLSYSPSSRGESLCTNFTFPFQNLHPGETLEVSLPLAAAGDESFPVTASCSLVFSLLSLLGDEAAGHPGLHSSCISLPLNTLTVDWLHALQVDSPITTFNKTTTQSDNTADSIQAFINSRRIMCSGRGEGGEKISKSEPEKFSAKFQVSSELVRGMLGVGNSDSDLHCNVSLSLLDWLLSEHHGGVKSGHGERTTVSSPVIHARGPNNHTVTLTAKEVNIGEGIMGNEESLTTVEVKIESSSLAAVCGLHHAVVHRVQCLLQRVPDRAASTKSIKILALRPALHRAELLLQQIQQTHISAGFGVSVSTGQTTRSLLSVYRELRENPLLII
ncbi:Fanconi anemia core complex-associated protein 100 [Cheilinus undulatus]|uniref:Fanconi anemia core complex-associated protein 100 n=1 Tax=Cheilinus undulatus TaxID=241271 RepID=UPI001BD45404|nr:Fanconi anemia core complex-associated protein 100 [Cheilinus undulatus]